MKNLCYNGSANTNSFVNSLEFLFQFFLYKREIEIISRFVLTNIFPWIKITVKF